MIREQSEFRSKYGRDDNKGPTEIVQLNPDIPPFDRFLAAWFKHKQPQLKTVGDKLALMDATFRAVPMQFDGLWRSNSRVGTQSVPVFGYRFSWREPGDRLGSYRPYNLMWRDVGGELGEFVDAYAQPPGFLTNVMQRSPMPGATLCPEAPRTP